MRVCPPTLVLLACALMGACSRSSSSSSATLLASSRIGPEGGLVVVQGGQQDGLVLEIPPGAVTEPVEFRVIQAIAPVVGTIPTAYAEPLAGHPFLIEPAPLTLDVECRLRVPYQPSSISGTGPGNVIVNQTNPWLNRLYAPHEVSVADGWLEVGIKSFGQFQVQLGDRAESLLDYTPVMDLTVPLTGGFEFVVEQEPSWSPFSVTGTQQWRLTGPFFDEAVVFLDGEIFGRRSVMQGWLEEWLAPYDPYQAAVSGVATPIPLSTLVNTASTASAYHASVMVLGSYVFSEPVEYNGQLELDVLKLSINVAYNRPDIGSGERKMTYWLSPRNGLLKVEVDGVVYERT